MNSNHRHPTRSFAAGAAMLLIAVLPTGCEFGVNPLILDGSVPTAKFSVDLEIPSFLPSRFTVGDSIDLDGLYEADGDVDSVKFYNLTFSSEGQAAGTETRITGTLRVNGVPFLIFDGTPLSEFSPERSVFAAAEGFSYDEAGVALIREALAPGSTHRTLWFSGDFGADTRSLHFTLQAKVYTQVFLRRPG